MKIGPLFLLSAFAVTLTVSYVCLRKAFPSAPQIYVAKNEFEFGPFKRGAKVDVAVPIANRGNEPLHVLRVKSSCACSTNTVESVIPPGATVPLRLQYDLSKKSVGIARESVAIQTDDPATPLKTLTMVLDIEGYWDVLPSHLRVYGKRGTKKERQVAIVNPHGQAFRITGLKSPSPFHSVELKEVAFNRLGTVLTVANITTDFSFPDNRNSAALVFKTSDPKRPELKMTIDAYVD